MKPDWTMVVAAALVGSLAGAAAVREFGAGRYQIVPVSSGVVARVHTVTGEVTGCRSGREAWPRFDCSAPLDGP